MHVFVKLFVILHLVSININTCMSKDKRQYVKPEAEMIDIDVEHDLLAASPTQEEIIIDKENFIDEDDQIL